MELGLRPNMRTIGGEGISVMLQGNNKPGKGKGKVSPTPRVFIKWEATKNQKEREREREAFPEREFWF